MITTGLPPLNSTRTSFPRSLSLGLEDSPSTIDGFLFILRESQISTHGVITPVSSILVFLALDGKELALHLVNQVAKGKS